MQNLNNILNSLPRLEALKAELAKRSFLEFIKFTMPEYKVNWHHEVLSEYIDAFCRHEIQNLMVFMPPQHGKSEQTSRRLPAYLFGINPNLRIISCSYSASLAVKFSRDVQRIIDNPVYKMVFPETSLSGKNVKKTSFGSYKRTSDEFEIVGHKGSYLAAGVGGGISGNPCDVGIIDDPLKGYIEANSPTIRDKIWGWYVSDFLSRTHNDSRKIITQTRWHPDDLSGRILDSPNAKEWEVVKLEAIKTQHFIQQDPRNTGEALWEQRHSKTKLLRAKAADPVMFDALYQQDPSIPKETLFAYNFDATTHIKDVEFDNVLPIHQSCDFNVTPYMSSLIFQMEYIEDDEWMNHEGFYEVRVIDEYALKHPLNNAQSLGETLASNYNEHLRRGFFLYGDASGNNRLGVRGEVTTHFKGVMQGYNEFKPYCIKRVPTTNPRYAPIDPKSLGRRTFLNYILAGSKPVRLMISPKCTNLIEDLKNAQTDPNGRLDKKKDSKGQEMYGHMLDALQYFLCHPKTLGHLAILE